MFKKVKHRLYILAGENRWWGRAIWQTCLCFSNQEILYSMSLNHFITAPSLFSSVFVSLFFSLHSRSLPSLSSLAYYHLSMCQTLSNPRASLLFPCFSPQLAVLFSHDTSNMEEEKLVLYAITECILPWTTTRFTPFCGGLTG